LRFGRGAARYRARLIVATGEGTAPRASARLEELDGLVAEAEARLLVLSFVVERAVEDGRFLSVAEVADVLGLSRARLAQIMRQRRAPVVQEILLLGAP